MLDGDARNHAHIRRSNLRQPRELSAMRHAHLHYGRIVLIIELQQRKRHTILIVQIPLRLQYAEPRGHKRRKDFFRGSFANRPGHSPDSPARLRLAPNLAGTRGQTMQPDERVVHGKELAPDFFWVLWKLFARHHPRRSSARKRPGHKSVSVV